jgi:hypothetical protein
VKEDDRRKKEQIAQKKSMQRQNIEAFVDSKRRWEEREKERIRLEEAKIQEFLGKKEAWYDSLVLCSNKFGYF